MITTTEEGIATSKELPLGKYTLKETKTPAGLAMNYKEYEVVLEKDSENKVVDISLDIENDVIDTEINVYKVGEMLNPAMVHLIMAKNHWRAFILAFTQMKISRIIKTKLF